MFEPPDDTRAEIALREELRALPVPEASPDFDGHVLTALHEPASWWQALWQAARPVLSGAACSSLVTLALLHWCSQMPAEHFPARDRGGANAVARGETPDRPSLRTDLLSRHLAFRLLSGMDTEDPSAGKPGPVPKRVAPARPPEQIRGGRTRGSARPPVAPVA